MKYKIANCLIAILIVTSGLTAFTGNAAAVHECDSIDALVLGFSFGTMNQDKCTNNHVDHAVEEVRDAENQQTKVDLYQAGSSQKGESENFEAVYGNYLNDTESIAWSKAEVAIMEAYENGKSKTYAKSKARQAIEDYYTIKQINLIESWNTTLMGHDYLRERSNQEGFSEYAFVDYTTEPDGSAEYNVTIMGRSQTSVQLINGSSYTTESIDIKAEEENYAPDYRTGTQTFHPASNNAPYTWELEDSNYDTDTTVYGMGIEPPNSNYQYLSMMRFKPYHTKWNAIEQKQSDLQNETGTFVDSVWPAIENGDIEPNEVISRNTQMFEYGTDNTGNKSYYDVIGALAGMGLDTPDLNGTGQMTVGYQNNTYNGMLFARNVPNSTWKIGKTYNSENINGPVWIGTTNGEMVKVDGNFTIKEAVTKDGDSVQEVETKDYNYQTSDSTEMQKKMNDLLKLTQELQNRSDAVGSGGSGSSGNSTIPTWLTNKYGPIPLWGWFAMVLAGVYVLQSQRS